jgi:GT2 family glycosyltransferase
MTTVTESPNIAVVLVNWNNEGDTAECLASLAEQTYDDFCVIVVDNGSKQESIDYLTERFDWPIYIRNNENLGATGGYNSGIREALDRDAEYVLLLNNDTAVEPMFLVDLVGSLDDLPADAGVVEPAIHTYESNNLWAAGADINLYTGSTSHRHENPPYNEAEPVDYAVAAAVLIDTDVFRDVGLIDDDFFIYYDEPEFCTRARDAGWSVWYVPVFGVAHKESNDYTHAVFHDYYYTRNRWLFIQKTQPLYRRLIFYPYFFSRMVIIQIIYLIVIKRKPGAALATLKGAIHALLGKTGKLSD